MPQPTGPRASGASGSDAEAAGDAATASDASAPARAPGNGAGSDPAQVVASTTNGSAGAGAPNGAGSAHHAVSVNGIAGENGKPQATSDPEQAGQARGSLDGAAAAPRSMWRGLPALAARSGSALRLHWLASILVAAGVVFRVLTMMAYHPAIIYIDTLKYLYDAWPGSDPVGYKIPLKIILAFGDLGTVAVVQHLLGLAMAIVLYAVMIRRGAPRWLGAIAIAPVLLDGYQLQAEAMIMPDVWFEAFIVAGIAFLLWNPRPRLRMLIIGGLLFGASVGLRQAGEILILPALVFVVFLGGGWRTVLKNAVAITAAFGVAVLLYLSASYDLAHHFYISRSSSSLTYGRMASAANCATLNLTTAERLLCPTKAEQAKGNDWLQHGLTGPLRSLPARVATLVAARKLPASYLAEAGTNGPIVAGFNRAVETQQPLRVLSGILKDSVKLFAVARHTDAGDTPIWRWQFQGNFPSYCPYIIVNGCAPSTRVPANGIYLGFPHPPAPLTIKKLDPAFGGPPQVDAPIARFLRSYQLGGGYTPGPAFALFLVAGLIGSLLIFARRRIAGADRGLALSCLTFFVAGVAVLALSDAFEFTWRYQLPALVTLPPAGALGIGVMIVAARRRRRQASTDAQPERAPELASPAQ